ncbi:diaminopropionate ammonia-lyase [Cognatiyoonia sediminum]|uniref:Diaminopropionate ammonia-lyase n=1 Tax=Cognatiyoonia sediminum TaxID=1508389 RepID=A0A1M5S433_9RHOB|nr:pyridoxal-phosphate dependent enzyme [Cognatiyoonia sediminum]SHH33347.1 diaminopropionate ammonia-lyase [Cognatiyoonia sediminum]
MTHSNLFDVSLPLALLGQCPVYAASPLDQRMIHGRSILIKDETDRMGLGAFKALGGVYAVAKLIEARHSGAVEAAGFQSAALRELASEMTFVCASAGNHGLAVAAGAKLFGACARIFLSKTVPEDFALRLKDKGAEVVRAGEDYEGSVAAAIEDAERTDALHLADGSWPGYTEPPRLVMEGYTVIAEEMRRQFEAGLNWPSHVYLQAGVGGLAAAIAYMIRLNWAIQPRIIVVEPDSAPCLKESVAAGKIMTVDGPESNMGRLDCKTPSMLAFNILKNCADDWVTISDQQALEAVKAAADYGYSTTASGGAGFAACQMDNADLPLVILSERGLEATASS